jgi:hypothetical protein
VRDVQEIKLYENAVLLKNAICSTAAMKSPKALFVSSDAAKVSISGEAIVAHKVVEAVERSIAKGITVGID